MSADADAGAFLTVLTVLWLLAMLAWQGTPPGRGQAAMTEQRVASLADAVEALDTALDLVLGVVQADPAAPDVDLLQRALSLIHEAQRRRYEVCLPADTGGD